MEFTTDKVENAKYVLEKEMEYQKERLEDERKQLLRMVEIDDADSIIAWAQNMKRTEIEIETIKAKQRLLDSIYGDDEK